MKTKKHCFFNNIRICLRCQEIYLFVILALFLSFCGCVSEKVNIQHNFGQDVFFLEKYTDSIVLNKGNSMIVVVPSFQGRVMTSTASGAEGNSYGWINYDLVKQGILTEEQAKGRLEEHIYVFGGEDRLWIGPEGGQYSIFFGPGSKFEFSDWHTPKPIDTEPFKLVNKTQSMAEFERYFELANFYGTKFKVKVERKVCLIERDEISKDLEIVIPDSISMVAYETENKLENVGSNPWEKETGLLSIWILGQYKPSSQTIVVIPFIDGAEDKLGKKVNDAYFGEISKDRLVVKDGFIFFKGDGKSRGKLGITPQRSKGIVASYDSDGKVLTIVTYKQPTNYFGYVNSLWNLQERPYDGDVIMSYNDGPVDIGKAPMGPFYEMETSSPAAQLNPSQSITHIHRTIHFEGSKQELNEICRTVLRLNLSDIENAFSASAI